MTQADVIARLNAALPTWRLTIELAECCTFEAVRWKIRQGTVFSGDASKGALFTALHAQAKECEALANALMFEDLAPARRQRISAKDVDNEIRRWQPSWGKWEFGWPAGSAAYLKSVGIVYDEATRRWYKV